VAANGFRFSLHWLLGLQAIRKQDAVLRLSIGLGLERIRSRSIPEKEARVGIANVLSGFGSGK